MKRALIVKKKWLDLILSTNKIWEIRGCNTKTRGRIGLIESGSGLIVGECVLVNSIPISFPELLSTYSRHGILKASEIKYKKPHAWVIERAKRYENPIPYKHPQGAVIWVKI